jgi:hypothetical protein
LDEPEKWDATLEEPFFTFEEFSNCRETYSPLLTRAFEELMMKPSVRDIRLVKEAGLAFHELC